MHTQRDNALTRWGIFVGVAVGLFALLWIGWSLVTHHYAGGGSIRSDTSISVGLRDAPTSLDLFDEDSDTAEAAGRALIGNVYETLVTRDQNNELQAGLASDWTVSDDGLTYTFDIRSGVEFSNGHTLDASDVVYSLRQAVDSGASDVDQLGSLASVEAPDSSTVVITLSSPNPTLPRVLSGRLGVVFDEQASIDYADEAVGSGPFTVGRFREGESITLERNDDYWGDASIPASVTLTYYDDDASMLTALQNDTIELAIPSEASAADSVSSDPTITIATGASTSSVVLAFNNGPDAITSDEQVRKAARHALDLDAIVESQPDAAQALGGPLTPLEPGYEDLTGLYPYDPTQTQSMLSYFAYGYLGTVHLVASHDYQELADTIVQQLQAGGFDVRLEVLADGEVSDRIAADDYDMVIIETAGGDNARGFSSSQSPYFYEDDDAQQAYAQAMAATNDADFQERMRAYARVLGEDAASGWLYARQCTVVAKSTVSGYPTAMVDQRLPLASVTKQ
ncbi:ABC transporter substrate-binding protein [Bifidobacterium eulemuris]|uniref:ABC transporter substrate-binding protein n=1 Tax=Bifidobacterium eulemuris TaxID=1765219 RepID=A0A261G3L1_9BIFI|nr:ABC transporter substrate-binding protein [Bifidobacterium eulemuris]OZG66012.1 ABC transporter substrate-binding protein [Bifidobacterium eulemuris]QOL32065.1 ABC transporter substrate-binding protein [Bifidobacterium eulemuris]